MADIDPCVNKRTEPNWRNLKYCGDFGVTVSLALLTLDASYDKHTNTEVVQTYNDTYVTLEEIRNGDT